VIKRKIFHRKGNGDIAFNNLTNKRMKAEGKLTINLPMRAGHEQDVLAILGAISPNDELLL
jgi:hypothetical protein